MHRHMATNVRQYKKRFSIDPKRLGATLFTFFILYVAYIILTPPSEIVDIVPSPDNNKTARLRKLYYISQPSYKIDYRMADQRVWLNLLNMPSYTNEPHATVTETIEWSPDSKLLFFKINDTPIWYYAFE